MLTEVPEQAEQQNRVVKAIYNESYFSRNVRQGSAVRNADRMRDLDQYKRGNYGFGEGKIYFEPMGSAGRLPFQMDDTNRFRVPMHVPASSSCLSRKLMHASRSSLLLSFLYPKGRYDTTVGTRRLDMAEMFRYGSTSTNWEH